MKTFTVQQVVAKWQRRAQDSEKDFKDAVNNTQKDPAALAIAAATLWKARMQEVLRGTTWEDSLKGVTQADWKKAMQTKGFANWVTGINAAGPKMTKFWNNYIQALQTIQTLLRNIPRDTDANRKRRMDENYNLMKGLKGTLKL